ncbi:Ferritin-like domain-containing protein [Dyadobacter koreensis]|uniref:Ferritin-like domain-containing protein n=1 Tax=Dyadobacter koreensis TaxID=408657 RepID=A0A1H6RB88_9BACT|nr:ferritin-like domain-containing protein [Dyadobacter koreensis]SEI49797.1 Ferritin-like domain-containing protein [Dyadobacter koreensis]
MINNNISQKDSDTKKGDESVLNRRLFLRSAGIATAVGTLAIGACKDDDDDMTPSTGTTVDLGRDDVGILNYAYALEQLEAAFYEQVVKTPYTGITAAETAILTDIRDHEIIHRDFFKAALTAAAPTQIIPSLEVDFSSIDFTNRAKVLGAAKLFEDTGVAAYNGAGKFIKNATYLTLAGKIVSVEARHAAAISDLITPKTADFASDTQIDTNGLDKATPSATILAAVQPYLKTKISGANLPK